MKKFLALLLASTMVLTLAACNGGSSQPATEPAAPAASATVDALTVRASSTFNENETGGIILKYFIDRVSELSNGAITVKMTWGGTLFDTMGEFDAVADGAVDMVALGHMPHTGTLNYLGFPGFAPGGTQKAIDYFRELMFVNPETSKLIQDEAASYNIKYLNVIAGGANAICTKYSFTDLASLVSGSKSFGNFSAAQWEALGFQVTGLAPPDIYDGLNRGMIDSTQMGFSPMIAMAWYEVAPYWALDESYTAGNPFTVNLSWWNGLSTAQQEIIQQAALETEAYSCTIYDDAIASDVALVEEKTGNKFVQFNQADIDKLWAACFDATADSALTNAAKNGKEAGMVTVLEVAAKITGYDWKH